MKLAVRAAVQETGFNNTATRHTFLHSFATYLLEMVYILCTRTFFGEADAHLDLPRQSKRVRY